MIVPYEGTRVRFEKLRLSNKTKNKQRIIHYTCYAAMFFSFIFFMPIIISVCRRCNTFLDISSHSFVCSGSSHHVLFTVSFDFLSLSIVESCLLLLFRQAFFSRYSLFRLTFQLFNIDAFFTCISLSFYH